MEAMKKMTALISCLLTTVLGCATPPAMGASVICMSGDNFKVRPKCKAGEVTLNAQVLASNLAGRVAAGPPGPAGPQGPQGPQGPSGVSSVKGLDMASCRTVTNSNATTKGTTNAMVECTQSEFLLNYGWYTEGAALDVARWEKLEYRNNVPFGVGLIVQTELSTGSFMQSFTLNVTGTCCPMPS